MDMHNKRLSHPVPQFMRESWLTLNGNWGFAFDKDNKGLEEKWFKGKELPLEINVPFVFESKLSNVEAKEKCNVIWYKKNIELEPEKGKRILLHFEAVDYATDVWVNGEHVGSHEGGFVPFAFDISNAAVAGENNIVARVEDHTSCRQPLGKQSWKGENFLCWYTTTTGIWRDVWIEEVPVEYIESIYITPDVKLSAVDIEVYMNNMAGKGSLEAEILFAGKSITTGSQMVQEGKCKIRLDVSSNDPDFRVHYWEPGTPNLYDLKLTLKSEWGEDSVLSYFGMRKVHSENGKIYLNNKEFYQKLVLNQGYYGDALMTPPSVDWLVEDVKKIKAFGFNGVRMHQKIEDNRFAYLCDHYGLVMWAEMPSSYDFDKKTSVRVLSEIEKLVQKHYNNPSVIAWTLFNESWGLNEIYDNRSQQSFVDSVYYYVKHIDPTRLVIGNDGWEHTLTDVLTIHDYSYEGAFEKRYNKIHEHVNGVLSQTSLRKNYAKGYRYSDEPIMVSEYGGIAYAKEHNEQDSWGYGERLNDADEVIERFKHITESLMSIDEICGFCYTQLTDVEQEINGLLDHNHEYKFDPGRIKSILDNGRKGGFVFA